MSIRSEIEHIADELPVAIYLVAEDGHFVFANDRLRKLLHLPSGDLADRSMEEFYVDPRVRQQMIARVRGGEAVIERRTVCLKVDNREIDVLMYCREARGEDGAVLGFLGVLLERTAEAEFQHVFDAYLPAGVYRLDAQDNITHANLAFAKLHGFDNVEDILGRNARDFYANPADADWVKGLLRDQQGLHRKQVTLKRPDGETFEAFLTTIPFFTHGEYAGRGGLVEDRTSEERYQRIFDEIPVGLYVAETREGKDLVTHCNLEFARIHDVESRDEMIGRDLRGFHHSLEQSRQFLQEVVAAATQHDAIRADLQIRTDSGSVKTLEIHSRPQVAAGKVIGRTGAVRDVTAEVSMRDTMKEMTNDIGAILHTLKHTLAQLKHSIAAVSDVLGGAPDTHTSSYTPEELEARVRGPLRELAGAVEALVDASGSATHAVALPPQDVEKLRLLLDVITRTRRELPPAHWRLTWLKAAVEIEHIASHVPPGTVARSAYRPVIAAAQRIASMMAMATLASAREVIEEIDVPLMSFRDFVTSGARTAEQQEICFIEDCIHDAINNVTGFAEDRRVQIRFDDNTHFRVRVARRDVIRAINNLLHNAIKYSWRREDDKTWIGISVSLSERAMVTVAVENWGVPIPPEEIQTGLVFRLGFRGRLSSDRGRPGTGVGLADSMRVARAHGGDLRIQSRPASNSDPEDYTKPFITTAYFELPQAREGYPRR